MRRKGRVEICLTVVVILVFCELPSCQAELARGFIFERNEYAYKIVLKHDDRRTFYEAEEICQLEENGHLVSITSKEENQWLNDKIRRVAQTGDTEIFWVGANDKHKYGHYKWTDGARFVFSKTLWLAGRPYSHEPQEYERCVTFRSRPHTAAWVDEDCYEVFGYICKTEGLPKRLVESKRWGYEFDYGDYIYKFILMPYDMLTWPEADMYCGTVETGYLLSIKNPTENLRIRRHLRQLRQIFGFTRLWIGGNDLSKEGRFVWTDKKTKVGFQNWAPGEPSGRRGNEEHDCVAMGMRSGVGAWHDEYCLQHLPFICKIRMCNVRADLAFAVDSSGSVTVDGFWEAKRFVKAIVDKFQVSKKRAHVGVIRYSTKSKIIFSFDQYYSPVSLAYAIDDIEYTEGGTRTELALQLARNKLFTEKGGARQAIPKFLVLMTDGKSENPKMVAREAKRLKMSGVYVIAVGIGEGVNKDELLSIASSPYDVINVKSFRSLVKRVAEVRDKVCDGVNPLTSGS